MTNLIDMAEQSFSSSTSVGHVAITMGDTQLRTVETNSRTRYERWVFGRGVTNPKVAVKHPDESGDVYNPTRLFLQLIDHEIVNNPDALIPADESQITRLKQLLKDVEV